MEEHLLSIEHLSVSFAVDAGEVNAVQDVNLFLDSGEILVVVGESGCGKSVTAKSVMRLLPTPPAYYKNSAIRYKGIDLLKLSEKQMLDYRGQEIALISQDSLSGLNPTMTVGKQICESIMTHRKVSFAQAKKIAVEKMQAVRLPDPERMLRRYPHTLSGGQRQRIMIAMAISCNPQIILADEPTTALDPTIQMYILDILRELKQKQNIAVMLITHDLRVASAVADRIAVMYAGNVVESGTAEQLFRNPSHPYTWGLLSALPEQESTPKSMLYSINGAPPELQNRTGGCPFVPRCPYAMKVCTKAPPPAFSPDVGHTCHCWLLDSRSPGVQIPDQIRKLKGGGQNGN